MAESSGRGRKLARGLGIDVDHRSRAEPTAAMRDAAIRVPGLDEHDLFFEREPTVAEWLSDHKPTRSGVVAYLRALFPFWNWIFHYNVQWLMGDIVAGEQ